MIISNGTLQTLFTGFSTAFAGGFGATPSSYRRVAQVVPSSTRQNEYGWMGQIPRVREWVGDRVVQNISTSAYTIRNRDFELTVGVKRTDIEDDNLGVYSTLFSELGRSAGSFPDELLWPLVAAGFATACYDGQYFFDSDHPVLDASGVPQSQSNTGGGAGTAWYLFDTSRMMKPFIFQERKAMSQLIRKDQETDDNVFTKGEFVYGTDGRCNVGYGFWQLAYGSKQTLDAAAYATARANISGRTGDYGRPLGLTPNLLVVPPSLEGAGRDILESDTLSTGGRNKWYKTAELLVVPWLQ